MELNQNMETIQEGTSEMLRWRAAHVELTQKEHGVPTEREGLGGESQCVRLTPDREPPSRELAVRRGSRPWRVGGRLATGTASPSSQFAQGRPCVGKVFTT